LLAPIPLQRGGTPTEIAHVITMLLHEDASYITGQIVRVDGGREHRRRIVRGAAHTVRCAIVRLA
jgi:NAD(P)-dependent dehydrogenase (short-subunit alcohol dehydrogenase family)